MATTRAPTRAAQLLSSVPRLAGWRALPSAAQRRSALVRLAVVGAVAGVAVAWAVASSTVLVNPVASGILRGAVVASCVAVGAYLAHRRPESHFGLLLAANGLLFGLTALNASSNPTVFTLGRVVNIVLWFSLAYLFLAFPGDTIRSARERSLLITLGAASVVAWVATLAVSDELPAGGQFLNCVATCPPNGLQVATVSSGVAASLRLTASMLAVALLAWHRGHPRVPDARRRAVAAPCVRGAAGDHDLDRRRRSDRHHAHGPAGYRTTSFTASARSGASARCCFRSASWPASCSGACSSARRRTASSPS